MGCSPFFLCTGMAFAPCASEGVSRRGDAKSFVVAASDVFPCCACCNFSIADYGCGMRND